MWYKFIKTLKNLFTGVLIWRMHNISDQKFLFTLSAIIGILAGIAAGILKTGVYYMHKFFQGSLNFDFHNYRIIVYPAIGILITVLFKKFVINDHGAHSISSILHTIAKRNSLMRLHKIFSSVTGAVFTAGFGGSVGLESPIISAGAAIGSNLGKVCRLNYKSITTLLGCGAAGGISAIFNTPIAGIVFCIEVLLLDMNRFSLIPLLIASVSGAITAHLFFPGYAFFEFATTQPFISKHILFYIFLGAFAGLVSYYFAKIFVAVDTYFSGIKSFYKRVLVGAPILGLLIYFFPALYGEGFNVIKLILNGNAIQVFNHSFLALFGNSVFIVLTYFVLLVLIKVFATSLTINSGGIGGIFAPSLFTGCILGFTFAFLINTVFNLNLPVANFALTGMAGMLAGVLHAPLTGIFLIAEITSGYQLIIPLMITTTMAYIVAKSLAPGSVVTWQLEQRGQILTHHKDKAVLQFLDVSNLVETDFFPIHESAKLDGLVKAITVSRRNIFPIINSDGFLTGIVLLDDIREIMFNTELYNTNIVNLMQIPPAVIDITESMDSALKKFSQNNSWNLPVCQNGRYIGFISKSKLFSVYRSKLIDLTED